LHGQVFGYMLAVSRGVNMVRHVVLATSVSILVSVSAWAEEMVVVSGTVVGRDGNPMALAHVHATRPAAHQALASVEARPDGGYRLGFEGEGLFLVRFTGVDHTLLDVPLLVDGPADVTLDVQLAAYPYVDFLDEVWLIGDFNRFSRLRNVMPMAKQADGTYVATVNTDAESLAYQLLGVEAWGRSINGTQADRFDYDGGGDYRSIIESADTVVTVTFDPRVLHMSEVPPKILFGSADESRVPLSDAYQELEQRRAVHQRRHDLKDQAIVMEAFEQPELSAWFSRRLGALPEEDLDGERALVLRLAREADSPAVRDMLYVYLLGLELLDAADPNPDVVQEVLANVAPDSPFWSLEPDALDALRFANAKEDLYRYLDILIAGHSDPYVRQSAFANAIVLAELSGTDAAARSYWELWQSDSAAVTDDYLLQLLVPDRAIRRGNPVPTFETVSLEDSSVIYRPEFFRGRTLLIDFWATWCPPCCGEMPRLHDVFERYRDRGLDILSVSFDRKPEDVRAFRGRRWTMPWHHAYADGGFGSDIAKAFEVRGIPRPVLVGGDGVIIASDFLLRGPDLDRTLRQVLGP
jgi:thiol-disulfide isomerase/thioredoxin